MHFYTKVAGVTFENRQSTIRRLYRFGELDEGTELILKREPDNPFDRNAVAVLTQEGESLGYLSKDLAEQLSGNMDRGKIYKAYVSAITGGDADNNYGINIQIQE